MDSPALRNKKGRCNLLRTLFLFEKYETNIDDVGVQRRNLEPKKWSVFDIVGIYSSGVKMILVKLPYVFT